MLLKETSIEELKLNPFTAIGKKWFLVTSGDISDYNTMTGGWGFMGNMWGKDAFEAVIRHNRYTFEFMEKNPLFTVCFFPDERRDVVSFCGSHSGRSCDKAAETGITPVSLDKTVAFDEAELVFVCRKMYAEDFNLGALEEDMNEKWYKNDPVHKQYIGEIIKVYTK